MLLLVRITDLSYYQNIMNNVETICDHMESKPPVPDSWYPSQRSPKGWWFMVAIAGKGMDWYPCDLTLDRLHEIEALLTDTGWIDYQNHLFAAIGPVTSFSEGINKLIHASLELRIAALAKVLRTS